MPLKTVFHHRISVLLPVLFSLVFFLPYVNGQLPGSFRFDTLKIPNWPAIHSFSYATYGNWVLMVGGRTDGIHGKENGFEFAQGNRNIYLWNVETSE
ncbi:MAG TPA: hypothetical protein VFX48_09075, partial [Saprospiraceae bacterium]|nr:hypothetical protein [Saprospiraceae bacterium]